MNQDLLMPSVGDYMGNIIRTDEGFHILARIGIGMPPASLVDLIAQMSVILSRIS